MHWSIYGGNGYMISSLFDNSADSFHIITGAVSDPSVEKNKSAKESYFDQNRKYLCCSVRTVVIRISMV